MVAKKEKNMNALISVAYYVVCVKAVIDVSRLFITFDLDVRC